MYSSAFTASIQAMKSLQTSFAAISDNIVNVNTNGYKKTEVTFEELVSLKQGGKFEQLSGSRPSLLNLIEKEGNVTLTSRALDAAMTGRGFFVTNTSVDGSGDFQLTEAGNFDRVIQGANDETFLADAGGNFLMAWPFDATSRTFTQGPGVESLQAVRVDGAAATFTALASSNGTVNANLPADAAIGDVHQVALSVVDGSGIADGINDGRDIFFTYTKTAANTWDVAVSVNGGTVTTPAANDTLTFDANGLNPTYAGSGGSTINVAVTWANPAGAANTLTVEMEDVTQFAGPFILRDQTSDGNTEGALESVFFAENGIIRGRFSNGLEQNIAKTPAGDVPANNRLRNVNSTHFEVTPESGDIFLVDMAASSRAVFSPGAVEASNTDLSVEISNMIITQRAYSSAATSLRTVDEMTKTATDTKK